MSFDSTLSSFDHVVPSNDSQNVESPSPIPLPTASVIVFGSQGSDFLNGFDAIFALSRRHPELAAFLSLALDAVRAELQSVANRRSDAPASSAPDSPSQQLAQVELLACLPPFEPFSNLKSLVEFHRCNKLEDPVINGVLLSLLQTASVVAVYCVTHHDDSASGVLSALSDTSSQLRQAWTALSQPCSHLLGYCTGALSAFSLRQLTEDMSTPALTDIWAYAREAVKAICICFWVSLRSAEGRLRLTRGEHSAVPSEFWSFLVSVKDADYMEKVYLRLAQFNALEEQRPLDPPARLVVTAKALNQVSIGGSPKVLKRFKAYLLDHLGSKCRVLPLKLFSPYHTPDLDLEVERVMEDLERRGLIDDSPIPPSQKILWETANANILSETGLRDAMRVLITSNLSSTADWDAMADQLILLYAELPPTAHSGHRLVVSFSPGTSLGADLNTRLSTLHDPLDSTISATHIDVSLLLHEHVIDLARTVSRTLLLPAPDVDGEEVVIVSMACRFPGDVRNPEQLWTCLETGRSTVTEIPKHLFDIDAYLGEGVNQTMARHMHALPENVVKSMDARLFSMSPKEIEQLDPQHRLVMLCSYEALERAGYSAEANSPSSFDGKRIAVCMAASWDDYRENASWNIGSYFITGNIRAFIPGHVSFSLKWEGPSVSVDTLECSAVSAIQWSRQALLSGQCDVALTGAVNVLTQPQMFIAMDKEGILSHSGTNATFSSKLDGKTRGDGCGVLLLKRRSTALRDGDKILATLPAARTAYHGVPSDNEEASDQQWQFLSRVLSEAGVRKSHLVHIEASGFHTQEGEAAEFESFHHLLEQPHVSRPMTAQKISVASSRPNIGAGEAVSAMASVIKAVLMFEKAVVPRQISIAHPSELQPSIAATCANSDLFVPTEAQRLPSAAYQKGRGIILVNSLASTNCHGVVLVGEPTVDEALPSHSQPANDLATSRGETDWVFVLSAKTKESAEMMKKALIDYLHRDVNLTDLSYALTCRRTHYPFRLCVLASQKDELVQGLRAAEFIEAKQQADLPPFALSLRRPASSSQQSMKAFFDLFPGLWERYHQISTNMAHGEAFDGAEIQLRMMQTCLALLLDDCGVGPSAVDSDIDPMHPLLSFLRGRQVSLVVRGRDVSSSYTWIKIGDTVKIAATAADKATPTASAADPRLLQRALFASLACLHQQGYHIRWVELFRPHLASLSCIETLPTYPFHMQEHWMEYHDRNLLQPKAADQGGSRAAKKSSADQPEAGQVEAYQPLAQPLLTEQTSADGEMAMYRSDLTDEAQATLLKSSSPGAVMVELMVEALREANESTAGATLVDKQRFWHLDDIHVHLNTKNWPNVVEARIGFMAAEPDQHENDISVFVDGDSIIASSAYRWVESAQQHQRWSKAIRLIQERVASILNNGEVFSARLVYKSLHSDRVKTANASQRAFLARSSGEAVICISVQPASMSCVEGQLAVLRLLSLLEESAIWYIGNQHAAIASDCSFGGAKELWMCDSWLESLTTQTSLANCFTVYISPTDDHDASKRGHSEPDVEFDMLILDDGLVVVGELVGFRLQQYSRGTQKTVSKTAAASVPHSVAASSTAGSAPQNEAKHPEPRSKPAHLVRTDPPRSTQTGRAASLHTKVLDVLAAELGIAIDEMKPNVKFADLGLDSLMSLVCISTLETLDLGFAVPQSLFMDCDSPAELSAWIRTQIGDSGDVCDTPECKPGDAPVIGEVTSGSHFWPAPIAAAPQDDYAAQAPRAGNTAVDETMKTIRSTIETELGVAPDSIDRDANLADLGLDSLMSLLVLGNLSGTLAIELPSSLFMDCASLGEIGSFVASRLGAGAREGGEGVEESVERGKVGVVKAPVEWTVPSAKRPVLLHRGKEGETPLFLLPDGSGMSTVYQHFLPIDRALYSINSPFLGDTTAWVGGITQIALYYLSCIKLVQPAGPWLVGGWSFGGMVAFEIARLLSTSTGADQIGALFLIDSPCPLVYPPLPLSIVDWIFTAPEVRDIAPPALSTRLIAHFKATVDSLLGWQPGFVADGRIKVWYVVADEALPGKIGEVHEVNETVRMLFRRGRGDAGADGWERLLDGVRVNGVKGANHFTLVREQGVAQVARVLQEGCRVALG